MYSRTVVALFALGVLPALALVQVDTFTPKTVVDSSAAMFQVPRSFILRAAAKMPEEHYGFRPTADVRSFGEIVGHIADGYLLICALAVGDKPPEDPRRTETTKATRAELIEALEAAGEYCDRAHQRLAGSKGGEMMDWFGGRHPRVTALSFSHSHAWEHYGNLVTYMRLKGLVPPSSEPRPMPSSQ